MPHNNNNNNILNLYSAFLGTQRCFKCTVWPDTFSTYFCTCQVFLGLFLSLFHGFPILILENSYVYQMDNVIKMSKSLFPLSVGVSQQFVSQWKHSHTVQTNGIQMKKMLPFWFTQPCFVICSQDQMDSNAEQYCRVVWMPPRVIKDNPIGL